MSVELYFGTDKRAGYYNDNNLLSCDAISSVTVIGDIISIDELHATAQGLPLNYGQFNDADELPVVTENGLNFMSVYGTIRDVPNIPFGTIIWYYINGNLAGKFYFQSATQRSKDTFEIVGTSAMGLLDSITHNGGIYVSSTVNAILADIIGSSITYTVADNIKNIEVSGWLPIASKKENLHQLLLAIGIDVKKDANGDMVFYFNDGNTEKTIPDSRVYYGGSVNFQTKVGRVDVTEHSFLALSSDEEQTLYDNADDDEVTNLRVEFQSAPVHDLRVTGTLTIVSSGVNYAVVSGQGVLYGKPYTHTTTIISAEASNGSTSVKTVTDCTLISALNGGNVAQRILAYYSSARVLSNDIIVNDEKSGERVTITDPFGEQKNAFIKSMDIVASRVVKASCEMICGYTPVFQGNTYGTSVVLTGSGNFTVPAGKKYLTVILIGGGQGGKGGGKGTKGGDTYYGSHDDTYDIDYYYEGAGGAGGIAGEGGAGGKIYQKVIAVNAGDVIAFSCGEGGNGGAANGGTGATGGETTFGDLSSDSGVSAVEGVTDRFGGLTYGTKGNAGTAGGNGGKGWYSTYYPASSGSSVGVYNGGAGGSAKDDYYGTNSEYGGGGGGGAAMGANGGKGGDATNWWGCGSGGTGATATIAGTDATVYGAGGNGGNGGGGGGGAGGADIWNDEYKSLFDSGVGGAGGNGSVGGKGANGCIILYV